MVSKSPGRSASERTGCLVMCIAPTAEPNVAGRRQHGLTRQVTSAGLHRQHGDTGHAKQLEQPVSSQRESLWRSPLLIRPGFPFCLPRMAPLYTRGPPSARNSVRRTIVQLQRPSPQPALTCDRLESLLSGHFSDTAPHLYPFFARRASLHSAARQPAGTGSAQILRSMSPSSRRVRCPSARRSQ